MTEPKRERPSVPELMLPLHDEDGELIAWHLETTGELIPLTAADEESTP
jgi:hypothetical protein